MTAKNFRMVYLQKDSFINIYQIFEKQSYNIMSGISAEKLFLWSRFIFPD